MPIGVSQTAQECLSLPVFTLVAAGEVWGLNTKSSEDVPKSNAG